MSWFDFIVLTLAAGGVIDVWFNGSIFATWREFAAVAAEEDPDLRGTPEQAADDPQGEPAPLMMRVASKCLPRLLFELLSCDFCFSYHVPWILLVLFFVPAHFITIPWVIFLLKVPVYSLAATRLGNLINALLPSEARYIND